MNSVEQLRGVLYLMGGTITFLLLAGILRTISSLLDRKEKVLDDSHWYYTIPLKIIDIIEQASDIKTFRLSRVDGAHFPQFKAGQFITVQIPGENGGVLRSYSITSSVFNDRVIDISIKKIPEGVGSGHMHQRRVGDTINAFAPSGNFILDEKAEKEIVLIAGGIGITPMTSMIRSSFDFGMNSPVSLFYAARTIKDLAFDGIFDIISGESSRFNYYPILSNEEQEGVDKGFLTIDYLKTKMSSLQGKLYYLCGPPPMADGIEIALRNEGVEATSIFREKFVMPTQLDADEIEEHDVTVTVNGKKLHYQGKQNLLDFLLANEVNAYYSCKTGVCGTCKCKMSSGEVEMLSKSGLGPGEEEAGEILPCVSFPKSDIEIKLGEN